MYRVIGFVLFLILTGLIAHSEPLKDRSNGEIPQSLLSDDSTPQCGKQLKRNDRDFATLYDFGDEEGVDFPGVFANVVDYLHEENRLPECYITKRKARALGWQKGVPLNKAAPGKSIGGDYFGNWQGYLLAQYNGDYREADLDYVANGRGSHRLVYVRGRADEGLIWLTINHYNSFIPIYCDGIVCD